jgi:hypothetical protein
MRLSILFAVGAFALAGCAADATTTEGPVATADEALSTFAAPLVGSYARIDDGMQLSALTLNANGSYGRDDQVYCFRAPCNPIHTTGTWSASGTGFSGTLKLHPTGGTSTYYAVTLTGPLGSLDLKANGVTIHEERTPATCGGIAALSCASGFTCVYPNGSGPSFPDEGGQCLPRGAQGTMCGGIAGFPCFSGLTCNITATYPDAAGTCQ